MTGEVAGMRSRNLGNGGGVQMMAGARAVSLDIEVNAGELINFKSDFEGLSYYYDPIEITSSTKYLDFTDDDGTFAAIIAPGYYKTPKALASAISAAMDAANSGETHTCTYSDTTGRFTIISTGNSWPGRVLQFRNVSKSPSALPAST